MINSLGGRKFIMTMGCGIITTALVWFGKIDGAIYATVIIATVGAFIAGNAYTTKGAPPAD